MIERSEPEGKKRQLIKKTTQPVANDGDEQNPMDEGQRRRSANSACLRLLRKLQFLDSYAFADSLPIPASLSIS